MTELFTDPRTLLRPLALLALGKTGADIERLLRDIRRTARRSGRGITWHDLETGLRAGQASMSADLRSRAAIHEAGHALVYTLTGIAEVQSASVALHGVGLVTAVPNAHLPETEAWLMSTIAALLAGRAAEILVFEEPIAGAGGADESDLARATAMALAAETSLGFSRQQPLRYRSIAMGMHESTIDRELADRVNRRLECAEAMAHDLIKANRSALDEIASGLESVGILSGDEVRRIVRGSVGDSEKGEP